MSNRHSQPSGTDNVLFVPLKGFNITLTAMPLNGRLAMLGAAAPLPHQAKARCPGRDGEAPRL